MIESSDFQTLCLLFRRPGALPPLPAHTMRLIRKIDEADSSIGDLEPIVASDPFLTADVLRLSNSGEYGGCPGGSLRGAIFLIGQRSLKALAVSSLVQNVLRSESNESLFDPRTFAGHSMFVGLSARYVAARAEQSGKSLGCTPDEVFAAGMLDDIGVALLARVAPKIYNRLYLWAKRQGKTLNASFFALYGHAPSQLASEAVRSMGLPPLFLSFIDHAHEPWMCDELYTGLCAVRYANRLSLETEWRMEPWSVDTEMPLEVSDEVGLPPEELAIVLPTVSSTVSAAMAGSPQGLRAAA